MLPCCCEPAKSFWARIWEHLGQLGMNKCTGPGRMHQGVPRALVNVSLKSPGDCRRPLTAGKR